MFEFDKLLSFSELSLSTLPSCTLWYTLCAAKPQCGVCLSRSLFHHNISQWNEEDRIIRSWCLDPIYNSLRVCKLDVSRVFFFGCTWPHQENLAVTRVLVFHNILSHRMKKASSLSFLGLVLFLCLFERTSWILVYDFSKRKWQFGHLHWRDSNEARLYCSASTIEWIELERKGHSCNNIAYLRDLLSESWDCCYRGTSFVETTRFTIAKRRKLLNCWSGYEIHILCLIGVVVLHLL